MSTGLIDATRQETAPEQSRWTLTSPNRIAELRVDIRAGDPYAEVHGEIDIASAPWLREELLRVILWHGPRLALDLSGVTFMDCAGVGALVAMRRRARLVGGWLRVIEASPAVGRTIALAGLQQLFTPAVQVPASRTAVA